MAGGHGDRRNHAGPQTTPAAGRGQPEPPGPGTAAAGGPSAQPLQLQGELAGLESLLQGAEQHP